MTRALILALLCACSHHASHDADAGVIGGDAAICAPAIAPAYPDGMPTIEYSDAYAATELPAWWVEFQVVRISNQRADALGCCGFEASANTWPAWPADCGALEEWWPAVEQLHLTSSCAELEAAAADALVCRGAP